MTAAPVNVAAHLARMAAAAPTQPALHLPRRGGGYRTLAFADLNRTADAVAHGLTRLGVSRGTRVALMVPPGEDFFAVTFALFKLAAVPVLIDPGMGVKNLGVCLGEASPEAFIGVPKAHLARRLLGWARGSVRLTVTAGRRRWGSRASTRALADSGLSLGPYPSPEVSPDDTAAVLFTSGSTGVAKGAVYPHRAFAAQVEMLKDTYGIRPGEIDLCTFPLFALFGPALGMTCVVPDMNPARPATADPAKLAAQIERFGVTNLFASPAVVRRLADHNGPVFRTVRRAISAGAPATPAVLERFVKRLPPGVQVFTPYGATEALPVANVGSDEILSETRHLTDQGKGVCVGRPVAGITVSVIPISDEPILEWDDALCLPPGEIGEFVVRGPVVTPEYFRRPAATALAKIRDPRTGDILHRMGDVGYVDARGRLWFCGRKSHRVVTPAGTLYTDCVEPIFTTVPGVERSALVGVTRDGVTHPVLCVEPKPAERVSSAALAERAASHAHTTGIATFLFHPRFPVDVRHNSKIFREKLAAWADAKLGRRWKGGPA